MTELTDLCINISGIPCISRQSHGWECVLSRTSSASQHICDSASYSDSKQRFISFRDKFLSEAAVLRNWSWNLTDTKKCWLLSLWKNYLKWSEKKMFENIKS